MTLQTTPERAGHWGGLDVLILKTEHKQNSPSELMCSDNSSFKKKSDGIVVLAENRD